MRKYIVQFKDDVLEICVNVPDESRTSQLQDRGRGFELDKSQGIRAVIN